VEGRDSDAASGGNLADGELIERGEASCGHSLFLLDLNLG
jgi:hypothetical protein